jgi:hypothetical protein
MILDNTVMISCFDKKFNIVNTFILYANVNFMEKGTVQKKSSIYAPVTY